MARDKIQPLKIEGPDTGGTEEDLFPTSADPQEDFVETMGLVINDASNRDETTVIERLGDDMLFQDGNNTTAVSLSTLMSGGGITEAQHEALDTLVHELAEDFYEEYTYTGNVITNVVTWETSSKLKKVREYQYTYVANKISVEVIIQYDSSGVEDYRITYTYNYSGNKISTVGAVRS